MDKLSVGQTDEPAGQRQTDDGEDSVRPRRMLVEVGFADAAVVFAFFELQLNLLWVADGDFDSD